ncbi:MAG: hypothetical protein ACJAS1_007183, partial [Oleiphilaceae bacterium]
FSTGKIKRSRVIKSWCLRGAKAIRYSKHI